MKKEKSVQKDNKEREPREDTPISCGTKSQDKLLAYASERKRSTYSFGK